MSAPRARHRVRASLRAIATILAIAVLVSWPKVAAACPVCFDARDKNRMAFLLTTIFLTLLPLAMIGGIVFWLRRRVRELEKLGEPDPPPGVDLPPDLGQNIPVIS